MIRPVLVTLAVLLGYAGYESWLTLAGARKLAALELRAPRGHYEIVVGFPPEAFHITRVQAIGRLIEVKSRSVFVMDVEPDDMRGIARNYWVEGVKPWRGL